MEAINVFFMGSVDMYIYFLTLGSYADHFYWYGKLADFKILL